MFRRYPLHITHRPTKRVRWKLKVRKGRHLRRPTNSRPPAAAIERARVERVDCGLKREWNEEAWSAEGPTGCRAQRG